MDRAVVVAGDNGAADAVAGARVARVEAVAVRVDLNPFQAAHARALGVRDARVQISRARLRLQGDRDRRLRIHIPGMMEIEIREGVGHEPGIRKTRGSNQPDSRTSCRPANP